jgi:hypothetical protein
MVDLPWGITGCENDLPLHVSIKCGFVMLAMKLIHHNANLGEKDTSG